MNISPREIKKFLSKNNWVVKSSKDCYKIEFANNVTVKGVTNFTTAKLHIHSKRNPVSDDLIWEIKEAFENILKIKMSKIVFNEYINRGKKIV